MTVIGPQDSITTLLSRQTSAAPLRAPVSAPVTTPAPTAAPAATTSVPAPSASAASLSSASANLAQMGSILQIAQSGAESVATVLSQLESLAQQAAGADSESIPGLNQRFQQLLAQIDRIVANATFNGSGVLSGALPDVPEMPVLTVASLFGSSQPSLISPEASTKAQAQVSNARQTVQNGSDKIKTAQKTAEFQIASVQTAQSNSIAATSVLTEADFADAVTDIFSELENQPGIAAAAQAGSLPPSLLSLLKD